MAIIGFCGQKTSKFLGTLGVKKVYIVAPVAISEIEAQGIPVEYKTIFAQYESYYKEERNLEFLKVIEEIKQMGEEDLVLFQCDYGTSRSYAAATVVARVLGVPDLTRIFIDGDGNIREGSDYVHDCSILAESMYDSLISHSSATSSDSTNCI